MGYTSPSTSLAFDFGSLDNGCKYAPNRLGYATMADDILIPITTPTAKLNWWQFVGAEQGADFYFIQLSTDGGVTWPDEIYRDSTDNLFWNESSIDLTAYIGRSIRLRFGFSSDQSFENFGWYVDDITIAGETLGDGVSAVAIGDASITEGDSGTGTLSFPLDISPVNAEEIVLEHMTVNGTAVAGLDYLASSGPFIIPANTDAITLDVAVLGDAFLEANETLSLVISNPTPNAIITLHTGVGTVIDNEELVTLYEEGFEADVGEISWLTEPDPNSLDPFPSWHIQNLTDVFEDPSGGGIGGQRFLTFNNNTGRTYDAPNGNLAGNPNSVINTTRTITTILIPDGDPMAMPVYSTTAQLSFSHFLEISYVSASDVITEARVEVSPDFVEWVTVETFGPTEPSDDLFVIPWQEHIVNLDAFIGESIYLRFVLAQPDEVNPHLARGWFIDDIKISHAPLPPNVSKVAIAPAVASEGNSGTQALLFPVTINPTSPSEIVLSFQTAEVTAGDSFLAVPNGGGAPVEFNGISSDQVAEADIDYVTIMSEIIIPAGASNATISVLTVGEDQPEPPEEFFQLQVANVSSNVFLANGQVMEPSKTTTILQPLRLASKIQTRPPRP